MQHLVHVIKVYGRSKLVENLEVEKHPFQQIFDAEVLPVATQKKLLTGLEMYWYSEASSPKNWIESNQLDALPFIEKIFYKNRKNFDGESPKTFGKMSTYVILASFLIR